MTGSLNRVCQRAVLHLQIEWLAFRLRRRKASALTMIEDGEAILNRGRRDGDLQAVADGSALSVRGWEMLIEIENKT